MGRKCISLLAEFTPEGKVMPKAINWEDGRSFEIDRVADIRRAASLKAGGIGVRYTCFIRGKQVYLFKDDDTWFIETD